MDAAMWKVAPLDRPRVPPVLPFLREFLPECGSDPRTYGLRNLRTHFLRESVPPGGRTPRRIGGARDWGRLALYSVGRGGHDGRTLYSRAAR